MNEVMGEHLAHTAGEWYITSYNGRLTIKGPGASPLADMYHPPSGDALSNARLMAAAPYFLALAQRIVKLSDESGVAGPLAEEARAAIARLA